MSANYPVQTYSREDWVSPPAQVIYDTLRSILGVGSDPKEITIFSTGTESKPYITYAYTDALGSKVVDSTDSLIDAARAFDYASYWLQRKQAALLSEGMTQEEAEIIT